MGDMVAYSKENVRRHAVNTKRQKLARLTNFKMNMIEIQRAGTEKYHKKKSTKKVPARDQIVENLVNYIKDPNDDESH